MVKDACHFYGIKHFWFVQKLSGIWSDQQNCDSAIYRFCFDICYLAYQSVGFGKESEQIDSSEKEQGDSNISDISRRKAVTYDSIQIFFYSLYILDCYNSIKCRSHLNNYSLSIPFLFLLAWQTEFSQKKFSL